MRRRAFLLGGAALLLQACTPAPNPSGNQTSSTPANTASSATPAGTAVAGAKTTPVTAVPPMTSPTPDKQAAIDAAIDAKVAAMTVEEKVGQLLMIGLTDVTKLTDPLRTLLRTDGYGGVIYFAGNMQSPQQVAALSADVQALARSAGAKIPAYICADQEGGLVVRITEDEGATVMPGEMALGATGSLDDDRLAARITATEMRAMGLNMDLAPVVDVNSNPANPVIGVRSYGSDPQKVAEFGVATIQTLQSLGVAATAKHFPGHGDTSQDSHIDLPSVTHDRATLDKIELVPFKAAIAAGVDAIMTAHVTFPAIDPTPGLPATLSSKVLTGLLRKELGFQGLILTDALGMGAITQKYTIPEAARLAFLAGADMMLMTDPNQGHASRNTLLEAAQKGTISKERLDDSVRRILRIKARRGLLQADDLKLPEGTLPTFGPAPSITVVGSDASRNEARKIALDAITLVRDQKKFVPLKPQAGKSILVVSPPVGVALTGVENPQYPAGSAATLANAIRLADPNVTVESIRTTLKVSADETGSILSRIDQGGISAVVVATLNAGSYPGQVTLVNKLIAGDLPAIVVALRSPYDLMAMPNVPCYIATYSDREAALWATGQIIMGKAEPKGKLPVAMNS